MKVKIIPAKSVIDFPRPMRVAAYCRVSTQQEVLSSIFRKFVSDKMKQRAGTPAMERLRSAYLP